MSPTSQKQTAFVGIPHLHNHKALLTNYLITSTHLSLKESEDMKPLSSLELANAYSKIRKYINTTTKSFTL